VELQEPDRSFPGEPRIAIESLEYVRDLGVGQGALQEVVIVGGRDSVELARADPTLVQGLDKLFVVSVFQGYLAPSGREQAILYGVDPLHRRELVIPEAEILLLRLGLGEDRGGPGPAVPVGGLAASLHGETIARPCW
jgi:hypothetical protein